MNAVQEMRNQVAEERAVRRKDKEEHRQRMLTTARQHLVDRLGSYVLKELKAEMSLNGSRVVVTWHYRGAVYRGSIDVTQENLADWMDSVDAEKEKYQAYRSDRRAGLLYECTKRPSTDRYNEMLCCQKQWELTDDEEVNAALSTFKAKLDALEVQLEAERSAARKARIQELLARIEAATYWHELAPIREQVLDEFGTDTGASLLKVLDEADERFRLAEEERVAKLAQAQADAFSPFTFYQVFYGVLVTGECGDRVIETESFYSVDPGPDGNGWWTTVWGVPVYVPFLAKVEEHQVSDPKEIPPWCPNCETEWGMIKVPPSGAASTDK